MILLLYASQWREPAKRLQTLIQSSFCGDGIEIYRTIGSFLHRLQHPPDLPFTILLLAGEREELFHFRSISHLLAGMRLLLIIPDQADETLKAAHRLRPRYLTYVDSDFSELAQVIKKLNAGQQQPF